MNECGNALFLCSCHVQELEIDADMSQNTGNSRAKKFSACLGRLLLYRELDSEYSSYRLSMHAMYLVWAYLLVMPMAWGTGACKYVY